MLQDQNDVASMQHMSDLAFDDIVFFEALDRHRQEEGLSWRQLGRQLGLSPSTFSRLARGRRPDIDTFLKLLAWLDVPASTFMRGAASGSNDAVGPDTLGVIASALRSDPAIPADAAGALEQLFRVAYGRLRTEPDGQRTRRGTSRRIDEGTNRSKGAL